MAVSSGVALITGAGGFAGQYLIDELERESQWDVVGIGRSARNAGARSRILSCDLRDINLLRRVVDRHRPDVIFHLAAQSYVPQSIADPADTIVNNVVSQINLFEVCRDLTLDPTILVVGSAEVYGPAQPEDMPLHESQPFKPANPYAVSKVTQDMLGLQYWLSYGMKIVRVRPFSHFGPGQSDRFALSNFARQIAGAELGYTEPVVLTGNLSAARDFLDVRDVVRAYRMAIERATPGSAYNIASGTAHPIEDLLRQLIEFAVIPISIRHDPARLRPSDTPILVGDAGAFREATGWTPRISIEETLRETLEFWRQSLRHHGENS